jgi:hypothetical protein
MNKRLAKIEKAQLEIQERGILNFWIFVKYEDGGGQGVGGIALDTYSKEMGHRVGTAYGCEIIRRLLLTLKVNDFSEMANRHIWVLGTGDGFSFDPTGVQALSVDDQGGEPLIFDEVLEQMLGEHNES